MPDEKEKSRFCRNYNILFEYFTLWNNRILKKQGKDNLAIPIYAILIGSKLREKRYKKGYFETHMESQDVETYFAALGDELQRQGFSSPVRVLVVGGVYMLLEIQNRVSTEDVDVWLLDMQGKDTTLDPSRETKAFKTAVNAVAHKHQLKRKWMNDDVAYFIRDMAPNPRPSLWKQFNMLHIYLPPREYILALKLMVFRQKDINDVQALLTLLNVITREQAQAIVDLFVPDKRWQEHYQLADTLDELF